MKDAHDRRASREDRWLAQAQRKIGELSVDLDILRAPDEEIDGRAHRLRR